MSDRARRDLIGGKQRTRAEYWTWWAPDDPYYNLEHFAVQYLMSDSGKTWTDGVQQPVLRVWELMWAGLAELHVKFKLDGRDVVTDKQERQYDAWHAFARFHGIPERVRNEHAYLTTPAGAWLWYVCRNDWPAMQKEIDENNMIIFDPTIAHKLMDEFNEAGGSPRRTRSAGAGPPLLIRPRRIPAPIVNGAGTVVKPPAEDPIRWWVMKVAETDPVRLCAARSPWP